MEPNQRDTPLRRFTTFWWALGLFVVFAIASFFIRGCVHSDKTDVDTARGKERIIKLEKNKAAEAESIKVDPATLFEKAGGTLNFTPADSGQPHSKQFGAAADKAPVKEEEAPAEEVPAAPAESTDPE